VIFICYISTTFLALLSMPLTEPFDGVHQTVVFWESLVVFAFIAGTVFFLLMGTCN